MIQVSQLTKIYGPRKAIDNLNFEVNQGEIIGFLGPNGAGKSTTMKILTGLMPASSGKANVAGFDVFDNPIEVKKRVGYLPENPPVYPDMQVEDYLYFAAALHQVPKKSVKSASNTALEKTGLTDVRKRLIGNLSKGYRQRVGLAQALVHNPEVLILDEPTVGLDPKQIIEIRELIKSFAKGHTVILSSHILPEVTATCQRIIIINQGKIAAEDTFESLSAKVNRGLTYTLVVRTATPEGINAIRAVAGVANVKATGNKLSVEMSSGGLDKRDQVVEVAVAKGMGVMEFSHEQLNLESVYLKIISSESGVNS